MPHDMSGSPYDVFKRKVEQDVIPPRNVEPSINHNLECLLLKALARKPGDRYVSIEEFATDIKNYLSFKPLTAALKTTQHEINTEVTAPGLAEIEKTSTSQNIGIIAGAATIMVIVGIIVLLSLLNSNPFTQNSIRTVPKQIVSKQTFERYEDQKYVFFSCLYPSGWKINELDDAQNRRVQFLGREVEIRVRITKAQGKEIQSSELPEMFANKSKELFPKEKATIINERTLSVTGVQTYEIQYQQNLPRARCRAIMLYADRRLHVLMFASESDSLFYKWSGGFDQFLESYATWRPYIDPKSRFACKIPPGWTVRETIGDPQSTVGFSCSDGEIDIVACDTGRHILYESDREEYVRIKQDSVQEAQKRGQQARLISVEWTSIGGIKGLKAETEFIEPERYWTKQMKLKRDGWDHCITLTIRSPGQRKYLEMLFDKFLEEYKNHSIEESEVASGNGEWTAYIDPKDRFVCKVPPGWIIREDRSDPRSKVSFSCKDGEIGIITRDTGRHILEESDRLEYIDVLQNVVNKAQQARLIGVEWVNIGGIKGLKAETDFIEPERFWAKQMKFKRDGWDHCITLTVRSPDQQKDLELLFDKFLEEYKKQSR